MIIDGRKLDIKAAERCITYKHLARAASVTEKTIQAAREGESVRTDTVGKIAAALGVPVSEILRD